MTIAPMSLDQIPGLTDSITRIAHSDPAKGWSPLRRSEDHWEPPQFNPGDPLEIIDCSCGRKVGGEHRNDWIGYEIDMHGKVSCDSCVDGF